LHANNNAQEQNGIGKTQNNLEENKTQFSALDNGRKNTGIVPEDGKGSS